HPIKLYYTKGDKIVPYENSIAVYEAFGSNKVTLEKSEQDVDHFTGCILWMLKVLQTSIHNGW
ncbi:MAG: hypothetical protein Q4A54_03280, partial [Parabacteroides sp.]|nr:hypothetical protein [Parabacteroides sp.]